jgi:putative membrane-bound dehydrogenase-like protein
MKLEQKLFRGSYLCLYFAILILLCGCGKTTTSTSREGSVPPSEAIATFDLEPGFQMELLASEPLISDPVDMEIDEYGRLYVVEMPGYPIDKSGTGKIKMLTDTDGDGQMDESMIFAENLTLPNGIMRWKNGFLVTDAPDVLYLEDTDGDGQADIREVILTGFSLSNPHVNVNNPVYGMDNWVYLSHLGHIGTRKYEEEFGDRGSEIVFAGKTGGPELPQNANGHTVRFRSEPQELEMTSSRSQFGQTFDSWGRHILTHNQNHIYHEVIAAGYLARNPELLVPNATQSISDHGNEAEVFQITTNPDRQLFTPPGLTTSSSGVTAYLGGIFPPPFDGNVVFGAESVSNLVHVDLLEEKGASFVAKRHREGKEFLASKDSWSRPVNMYIGPDGALYVVDYYRRIIEHPEWMSDEAVEAGGLYDGHEMGRIYRITPEGTGKADWTIGIKLGNESPLDWVRHLANPNIWWRQNAQRLLVEKNDKTVEQHLVNLVNESKSPEGRLHALWTLEGMDALRPELIATALKDKEAGIRENAIKLAELHLADAPDLAGDLLTLKDDSHPRVRFQLLCTLGFIDSPGAAKAREELLFRDLEDEWVQVAALSASTLQTIPLLNTVLARYDPEIPAYGSLVRRLMAMVAAGNQLEVVEQFLEKAIASESSKIQGWESAILDGITDGLRSKEGKPLESKALQEQVTRAFFDNPNATVRNSALSLLQVTGIENKQFLKENMDKAVSIAKDKSQPEEKRAEALQFLSLGDVSPYGAALKEMVVAQEQPMVQVNALKAFGDIEGTEVSEFVLARWETLTPEIRDVGLETFLSEPERVRMLLDALESKQVPIAAIGWNRRVRLMNNSQEELRERARDLLTQEQGEETIKNYQKALDLQGNSQEGKLVYGKNCAVCHQFRGGEGVEFGPDLGTVHNWLSKDLMANILDPNLSIAPGFDLWEVTMKNGERIQGMIMNETSSAISLRISPGMEKTIDRQEISNIKGLNMSLMPGLAGQIDQQQMADLLAFLRQME